MKPFKLFLLACTIVTLNSCKKDSLEIADKPHETQVVPLANEPAVPVYKFSALQLIYSTNEFGQTSYSNNFRMTKNYIVSMTPIRNMETVLKVIKTSNQSFVEYKLNKTLFDGYHPLVLDVEEKSVYLMTQTSALYKLDLATKAITPITDGLGEVYSIKSLGGGQLVLSSDLQNGSLIKIAGTTKTFIAKNLQAPFGFDIYKNEFYVVNNNIINEAVFRIGADGKITSLIKNLTAPKKILFDNNGNFILQDQITKGNGIYKIYDMYTAAGAYIGRVKDEQSKVIVSQGFYLKAFDISTEMYIDGFNNLFFFHSDGVPSGVTVNYCYPIIGDSGGGIWKVQLIKQ